MLSRSVNILLYFHLVIQQIEFMIVTKGTPRAGHPLKEGLRQEVVFDFKRDITTQSGTSTKRGIKT